MRVRIIAYDETEKTKIKALLPLNIKNVEFFIHPTDDVWVRDNGPFFVRNS